MTGSSQSESSLIKFVAVQSAVGLGISILSAAAILLTDAWGLATLISADASPILSSILFVGVGAAMLAPFVVATALFHNERSPETHD